MSKTRQSGSWWRLNNNRTRVVAAFLAAAACVSAAAIKSKGGRQSVPVSVSENELTAPELPRPSSERTIAASTDFPWCTSDPAVRDALFFELVSAQTLWFDSVDFAILLNWPPDNCSEGAIHSCCHALLRNGSDQMMPWRPLATDVSRASDFQTVVSAPGEIPKPERFWELRKDGSVVGYVGEEHRLKPGEVLDWKTHVRLPMAASGKEEFGVSRLVRKQIRWRILSSVPWETIRKRFNLAFVFDGMNVEPEETSQRGKGVLTVSENRTMLRPRLKIVWWPVSPDARSEAAKDVAGGAFAIVSIDVEQIECATDTALHDSRSLRHWVKPSYSHFANYKQQQLTANCAARAA